MSKKYQLLQKLLSWSRIVWEFIGSRGFLTLLFYVFTLGGYTIFLVFFSDKLSLKNRISVNLIIGLVFQFFGIVLASIALYRKKIKYRNKRRNLVKRFLLKIRYLFKRKENKKISAHTNLNVNLKVEAEFYPTFNSASDSVEDRLDALEENFIAYKEHQIRVNEKNINKLRVFNDLINKQEKAVNDLEVNLRSELEKIDLGDFTIDFHSIVLSTVGLIIILLSSIYESLLF